jgi:hypothetical protein
MRVGTGARTRARLRMKKEYPTLNLKVTILEELIKNGQEFSDILTKVYTI